MSGWNEALRRTHRIIMKDLEDRSRSIATRATFIEAGAIYVVGTTDVAALRDLHSRLAELRREVAGDEVFDEAGETTSDDKHTETER